MIRGIQRADYPAVRDKVLPFLEGFARRALDGTTALDLEAAILAADKQAWCINDFQALALTDVSRETVNITHCAGVRRHEWQEALDDEIKAWARSLGRKRVTAMVRPGWAKFGAARGYREVHREMVTEV